MLVAGDAIDVNVIITPPGVTFHIDSSNKQVLQTSPVDVPNNISISVNGQGCALVQVYEYSCFALPEPRLYIHQPKHIKLFTSTHIYIYIYIYIYIDNKPELVVTP